MNFCILAGGVICFSIQHFIQEKEYLRYGLMTVMFKCLNIFSPLNLNPKKKVPIIQAMDSKKKKNVNKTLEVKISHQ